MVITGAKVKMVNIGLESYVIYSAPEEETVEIPTTPLTPAVANYPLTGIVN